ncbi:hypothetical protein ACFWNU_15860, partial [Streptomyces sp. NPDC058427]
MPRGQGVTRTPQDCQQYAQQSRRRSIPDRRGHAGNLPQAPAVMYGMKISFLIHNAYGIGGTIATTFNLARALADRHEVEIISALRNRERPSLTPDPRVRLRPLVDL